jgi:hypothetical protein
MTSADIISDYLGDDPLCPDGFGKCYQHVNTMAVWTDAMVLCKQLDPGAQLVSIRSAFENQVVLRESTYSGRGCAWVIF